MGIAGEFGKQFAPQAAHLAPGITSRVVVEALNRAIDGVGPLGSAASAAQKQLDEQHGDVEKAIREVTENNVAMAGAQGFATNLGGIVTAAVAMPANIVGLAVLQCRLIAGIAHLRGYDLNDQRVRNAILACMLGDELVTDLVKRQKLPGDPLVLANMPEADLETRNVLATEVGAFLIGKVTGKRLVTFAGRRVPVLGGVIGAGTDSFSSWRAARYASKSFKPRNTRVVKGEATDA